MVQAEQIISQLLLRHSCVIVPDFGGFVAKRTAAVIDHSKGIMLPPKKGLLFNRQLINNDGLLISELSTKENISFDEASQAVKSMVNQWNSTLNRGARVTIDKVVPTFGVLNGILSLVPSRIKYLVPVVPNQLHLLTKLQSHQLDHLLLFLNPYNFLC